MVRLQTLEHYPLLQTVLHPKPQVSLVQILLLLKLDLVLYYYLQITPIPVKLILMQVSSVSLIITLLDQRMVQRLLQMALVYRSLMILPQQKTLPFQVLELVLMVQLETLQMTIH